MSIPAYDILETDMAVLLDNRLETILHILDTLAMSALIVDGTGKIAAANSAALSMFRYTLEDLAGADVAEILSSDPSLFPAPPNPSAINGEDLCGLRPQETHVESFCTTRNGEVFVAMVSIIPLPADDYSVIVIREISAQGKLGLPVGTTKLIGALRDKMKQIELINELSGMVNSSLSIGTIFRIMMSEIRKMITYDRGSILLYNEDDRNLVIFALDTDMETVLKKGIKAPLDSTSAGWVIKNNRPWINGDLAVAMRFTSDQKLLDEGIRSTVSIPLFQDRILGVFNLDSKEPCRYTEKDLRILLPVAKHISIALENALLFEEISREKKEWEKTFDAITDMVWIQGGRQHVIRANKTLLQKAGLSAFHVMGKSCNELLKRLGITRSECICSNTVSSKQPAFAEMKEAGGNIFHFWSYPLTDDDGRLYAIVHYLKDVTAQKRLEHQLVRADKLASLGTLVAGIAHEINNPLGIIAGYSEALIERARDEALLAMKEFEDFPEYLETINGEMFRCKEILKSLLEFARPHGGTFRELDVNELIKEVILLVNHKAVRLKHHIELRLNRDLPKITADPGSLRQLFMNIIINSMYYTHEGGSILIETGVDDNCGCNPSAGLITIVIADTGEGIPPHLLPRVFDPFFTTKPVGEGTGLGLSICHKIAEEHGGTIDVESEIGKGSRFIIKLPAKVHDKNSRC